MRVKMHLQLAVSRPSSLCKIVRQVSVGLEWIGRGVFLDVGGSGSLFCKSVTFRGFVL